MVDIIVKAIQEKKGKEIVTVNLTKIQNILSDYFIICHGDSNTQVSAISDSIAKIVYENAKEKPHHIEGSRNSVWLLMDYGSIIVHIFQKESRNYYNLEELWADGDVTKIQEQQ